MDHRFVITDKTRQEFVQAGGNLCRKLGLPRSVGQIYALLFLSRSPLSLEDITTNLGISKGSASLGTRQLAAWGAIRQVWMPGTRRDHFEAIDDLGGILRRTYRDFVKPRLLASEQRFQQLISGLENDRMRGDLSDEEHAFCAARLKRLGRIQKRIRSAAPVLERLL